MSESEKKRRQEYKKNRKKWILIQAAALALIFVLSLSSFLVYNRMNRTHYIEYTENGDVDYRVHLKENGFFEEEWVGKDQSYVSSLIDGMVADFSYELDMAADDVSFDYSYKIDAALVVADKETKDPIFCPVYSLVPSTKATVKSGNGVTVRESVYIDYNKYNDLASAFIDTYNLTHTTASLTVTMHVEVLGQSDAFEENAAGAYEVSLLVPLAAQTLSIEMTSTVPGEESKVLAYSQAINQNLFLVLGIVFASLAFLAAGGLLFFVYITKNEDITYINRVKKLVSAYRSFIQQMEGEFDTEGYQTVPIKTFVEMLGIRDTIGSPILMTENADQTMTKFLIPTATKLLYTFEIRVDNYDEIYGLTEEPLTEIPEEIHGQVLTFEDEEGTEEAIILDDTVDLEEITEAMATPDVHLEEVEFLADDDEDYEGTEEAPGIEVVGVVWPERAHRNKVYRYDPDGETLDTGDMVLVPTRDAAKERDVIRKAAIAHGNHIIDPALHPHPIKKIIGVIKRRAEAALTPDSEELAEEVRENENVQTEIPSEAAPLTEATEEMTEETTVEVIEEAAVEEISPEEAFADEEKSDEPSPGAE